MSNCIISQSVVRIVLLEQNNAICFRQLLTQLISHQEVHFELQSFIHLANHCEIRGHIWLGVVLHNRVYYLLFCSQLSRVEFEPAL